MYPRNNAPIIVDQVSSVLDHVSSARSRSRESTVVKMGCLVFSEGLFQCGCQRPIWYPKTPPAGSKEYRLHHK